MLKRKVNKLNNLTLYFSALLLIHIFMSTIIFDSYSIDRLILSVSLSLFVFYKILFKTSSLKNINIIKNPFVIFFIYLMFQTYFSTYINTPFEQTQQLFVSSTYLLATLISLLFLYSRYKIKDFLNLSFIASSIISLSLILYYFFNSLNGTCTLNDLILIFFKNIRVLNHLQTFIIPALGLLLYLSKDKVMRTLTLLILIFNVLLLIHTGARGSIYAIEFMYLILLISNLNNKHLLKHILTLQIIYIFTAAVYFLSVYYAMDNGNALHITELGANGRKEIYITVLPLLAEPKYIFEAIGFLSTDSALYGYFHPHNIFLFIYLGAGMVGLIIFTILSIYYGLKIINKYFTFHTYKRYYIAILIAVATHSMVSGLYVTPLTLILFMLYMAPLLKMCFKEDTATGKSNFKFINIFLLLITSSILLISTQKALEYKTRYNYQKDYNGTKKYNLGFMLYSKLIFHTEGKQDEYMNLKERIKLK